MNPNRDFRSRLPLPKSSLVFRSSVTNPRFLSADATERDGQPMLSSTGIKQPTTRQLIATSTGIRTTARLGAHPYLSSLRPSLRSITHGLEVNASAKEVVARLDFDIENKNSLLNSSNASSGSDLLHLSKLSGFSQSSPKSSEPSLKISTFSPKTFTPKTTAFSPKNITLSPKTVALSPKNITLSPKTMALSPKNTEP